MTLAFDDLVFRTRALAQTHPFSSPAQAYVNRLAMTERASQASAQMGDWAVHAVTAGYCLRRVEESDRGGDSAPPVRVAGDLDSLSTELAEKIRSEGAEEFLLYPEEVVVDALDRLIAGEIHRRLGREARQDLGDEAVDALEEYIAGWTIKGYALRVAEQILGRSE